MSTVNYDAFVFSWFQTAFTNGQLFFTDDPPPIGRLLTEGQYAGWLAVTTDNGPELWTPDQWHAYMQQQYMGPGKLVIHGTSNFPLYSQDAFTAWASAHPEVYALANQVLRQRFGLPDSYSDAQITAYFRANGIPENPNASGGGLISDLWSEFGPVLLTSIAAFFAGPGIGNAITSLTTSAATTALDVGATGAFDISGAAAAPGATTTIYGTEVATGAIAAPLTETQVATDVVNTVTQNTATLPDIPVDTALQPLNPGETQLTDFSVLSPATYQPLSFDSLKTVAQAAQTIAKGAAAAQALLATASGSKSTQQAHNTVTAPVATDAPLVDSGMLAAGVFLLALVARRKDRSA